MGAVGCSCSTPLTAQNGLEASNDILYNGVSEYKYFHARKYMSGEKMDFLMEQPNETEEERIERLALRSYGVEADFHRVDLYDYNKKTKASSTEITYAAPNFKKFYDIVSKNIKEGYYEHKSDKQLMIDMSGILKSSDPDMIENKKIIMKFESNPDKYKMDEDEGKLFEAVSEPWLLWTNPEDMIASFKS